MRLTVLILAFGAWVAHLPGAARNAEPVILLSERELALTKEALRRSSPELEAWTEALRLEAARRKQMGPWSVTFHRPDVEGLGPNDYFSEGPYWWPDPANPKGPYIRRDGERNPNLFTAHHDDLGRMSDTVLVLGLAAWGLGDENAGRRAVEVLETWFVRPETRMNPNLEFGQAIRGVTPGRGIGIIDTRPLIHAAQGVALLTGAPYWSAESQGAVRRWFAEYLHWMVTSRKGRDEQRNGNNHSTWWAAQAAAYAALLGDEKTLGEVFELHRSYLVPAQIREDGSCPREESRTRALAYSAMNLDGFSVLCRIGSLRGQDLWTYHTVDSGSVLKAVEYLAPFVAIPSSWTKPQITSFDPDRVTFLAFAGVAAKRQDWIRAYKRRDSPPSPWGLLVDLIVAVSRLD